MYRGETEFRAPTWLCILSPLLTSVPMLMTIVELRGDGLTWLFLGLFAISIVTLIGTISVFTDAICLGETELKARKDFRVSTVQRADIEKVTWAKGSNVSVLLKSGSWVSLPEVGRNSQGLCNSVRAWARAA